MVRVLYSGLYSYDQSYCRPYRFVQPSFTTRALPAAVTVDLIIADPVQEHTTSFQSRVSSSFMPSLLADQLSIMAVKRCRGSAGWPAPQGLCLLKYTYTNTLTKSSSPSPQLVLVSKHTALFAMLHRRYQLELQAFNNLLPIDGFLLQGDNLVETNPGYHSRPRSSKHQPTNNSIPQRMMTATQPPLHNNPAAAISTTSPFTTYSMEGLRALSPSSFTTMGGGSSSPNQQWDNITGGRRAEYHPPFFKGATEWENDAGKCLSREASLGGEQGRYNKRKSNSGFSEQEQPEEDLPATNKRALFEPRREQLDRDRMMVSREPEVEVLPPPVRRPREVIVIIDDDDDDDQVQTQHRPSLTTTTALNGVGVTIKTEKTATAQQPQGRSSSSSVVPGEGSVQASSSSPLSALHQEASNRSCPWGLSCPYYLLGLCSNSHHVKQER